MGPRFIEPPEPPVPTPLALFKAWERRIAEMAGLRTAFPCVPALFNLRTRVTVSEHLLEWFRNYSFVENPF